MGWFRLGWFRLGWEAEVVRWEAVPATAAAMKGDDTWCEVAKGDNWCVPSVPPCQSGLDLSLDLALATCLRRGCCRRFLIRSSTDSSTAAVRRPTPHWPPRLR